MIDYYPDIRFTHIAAVAVSGGLFLVRGLALFSGARWAMARPIRFLSQGIDTVLLAAALTLAAIVRQYPFVDAWLTVKVLLLAVYIALGIFAFRAGGGRARRVAAWLAALAVYGFIVSVAHARDPLGFLTFLRG